VRATHLKEEGGIKKEALPVSEKRGEDRLSDGRGVQRGEENTKDGKAVSERGEKPGVKTRGQDQSQILRGRGRQSCICVMLGVKKKKT